MIRLCSYCQRFLGERAPFDDPRISHGICKTCDASLELDGQVPDLAARVQVLVRRRLESARSRNGPECDAILAEARGLGLENEPLLVGMLQPALYQAGLAWQNGSMSVAAEHFLTSWAERVFGAVPLPALTHPVDVLVLQMAGNTHTLGPRLAVRLLALQGLSVDAVVPALPEQEMVELARELRPRAIGLSCALVPSLPDACQAIAALRSRLEPELRCRYALGGFAARTVGEASVRAMDPSVEVVLDVVDFANSLRHEKAGQ